MKQIIINEDSSVTFIDLPELIQNAIEVTDEQYSEYQKINYSLNKLVASKGKIKVVPRFSDKELASIELEKIKLQAQQLIDDSDYRVLQDKFPKYTKEQQEAIISYRESLREVLRGKSDKLPTFPEILL